MARIRNHPGEILKEGFLIPQGRYDNYASAYILRRTCRGMDLPLNLTVHSWGVAKR